MSPPSRKKPLALLATALLSGLIAAGLVGLSLRRIQAEAAASRPTVAVVVATADIPARTRLTKEMLAVRQIAPEARHPQSLAQPELVIGAVTKVPLVSEEQVLHAKLFGPREKTGLAFVLPPGQRAVAIEVSEIIASGGLIVPGDRVDVFSICRARGAPSSSRTTDGAAVGAGLRETGKAALVLQDLEVLAVGQRVLEEGKESPGENDKSQQPQPRAKSVTLAVSPAQAQRLLLYEDLCSLRLALRPFADTSTFRMAADELSYERVGQEGLDQQR